MFKVTTNQAAVEENAGASYVAKSGVYDVTIKFASVSTAASKAKSVNFSFEWEGNTQTIYGPNVVKKDQSHNEIGMKLINKLAIIAGMGDGQEPTIAQETHRVGKDNNEMEFAVITDFTDMDVKVRLQEEYSLYGGTIKKQMVIKSFFREDGASAEEIVNDTPVGVRLALETDKYAAHVTYLDNLTEEDVEAWKASKRSGGSAPAPKTTPSSGTKKAMFG